MAEVQRYFEQFNSEIRLKQYEENKILREKRDVVLKKLKERMKELFKEKDESVPKYSSFDQGSYKLGTGIKPLNGDFDIDVGLRFEVSIDDYLDPTIVKSWVYDSLDGHTKRVEMRRPCVTVFYQSGDEPMYHVDLAIYSDKEANSDNKIYLAKGKLSSLPENKYWEEADPEGLEITLKNRFTGADWEQFKRCIRYLKRWKDLKFPSDGNAAPVGIGITVAAFYWFDVEKTCIDSFSGKYKYDDLRAMINFLEKMHGNFRFVYKDDDYVERLEIVLPVTPKNDVFDKLTNKQMGYFKDHLKELIKVLKEAHSEVDPVKACEELQKIFGDDFPVPEKDETGQARGAAIITSSQSG